MVFLGVDKDLCLVFEATEGFGVQHTVAIALKGGADRIRRFRALSSARPGRACGPLRQVFDLPLFLSLTRRLCCQNLSLSCVLDVSGYRTESQKVKTEGAPSAFLLPLESEL